VKGQSAYDRPDHTCLVFKKRLDALLHNLRAGKYFDHHQVVYEVHVIEYQNRGLPHAHIVFKLSDMPTKEDPVAQGVWIDKHISACLPVLSDNPSAEELRAFNLVKNQMTHKHAKADNGCERADGTCKRGFDKTVITPRTTFDLRHFPVYKRLREADLLIVPHNLKILADWDGHANCEYAGSTYTVLYLYQYLFKGAKKASMMLRNADDVDDHDEVGLYLRTRKISSMDAMWRCYGYHTYPSPSPSVAVIKVRNAEFIAHYREKRMRCDMDVYFCRPRDGPLAPLKFQEFWEQYTILGPRSRRTREVIRIECDAWKDKFVNVARRVQLGNFARMAMLYPSAGESFYLRLILLRRAVKDMKDAYVHAGVRHETFQAAAIAAGYVDYQ
jgi:hypothetical protein